MFLALNKKCSVVVSGVILASFATGIQAAPLSTTVTINTTYGDSSTSGGDSGPIIEKSVRVPNVGSYANPSSSSTMPVGEGSTPSGGARVASPAGRTADGATTTDSGPPSSGRPAGDTTQEDTPPPTVTRPSWEELWSSFGLALGVLDSRPDFSYDAAQILFEVRPSSFTTGQEYFGLVPRRSTTAATYVPLGEF